MSAKVMPGAICDQSLPGKVPLLRYRTAARAIDLAVVLAGLWRWCFPDSEARQMLHDRIRGTM